MIINNFMGGLGNQLFQIATGYAHAKKINSQYAINYNLNHICMREIKLSQST